MWEVNAADPDRMKGTIERVRLPKLTLDTLSNLPRTDGSEYVFPGTSAALVSANCRHRPIAPRAALVAIGPKSIPDEPNDRIPGQLKHLGIPFPWARHRP